MGARKAANRRRANCSSPSSLAGTDTMGMQGSKCLFGQGLKDKNARLHLKLFVASRRMAVTSADSAAKAAGLGECTVLTSYAGHCLPLCSVSAPVMCRVAVKGATRTEGQGGFHS